MADKVINGSLDVTGGYKANGSSLQLGVKLYNHSFDFGENGVFEFYSTKDTPYTLSYKTFAVTKKAWFFENGNLSFGPHVFVSSVLAPRYHQLNIVQTNTLVDIYLDGDEGLVAYVVEGDDGILSYPLADTSDGPFTSTVSEADF